MLVHQKHADVLMKIPCCFVKNTGMFLSWSKLYESPFCFMPKNLFGFNDKNTGIPAEWHQPVS